MSEKNTGPDFGENFETRLKAETVSKLTGMGLSQKEAEAILIQEASDKLDSLKGDFLSEIQKTTSSKEKANAAVEQVELILSEHRKRLTEYMQAERQALSMQIEGSQYEGTGLRSGALQTLKAFGTVSIDFLKGFGETVLHPIESAQYVYSKADGKISDDDLNYQIT